jgi:dienelactone hydrolase
MRTFILFSFLLLHGVLHSQEHAPRSLSAEDYSQWKSIQQEVISSDGKSVVFELQPQRGDGVLIYKNPGNAIADTFPRGKKATVGSQGEFLVFHIQPPFDSVLTAKRKKVKKEEMPGDSLGIFISPKKKLYRYPGLKTYGVAEENSNWIAFLMSPEQKKDSALRTKTKKDEQENLVLFNVITTDTIMIRGVSSYHVARKGNSILIIRELKDSVQTESMVLIFDTNTGSFSEVFREQGTIIKPVTDETGSKYAFLFTPDTGKVKSYALYSGTRTQPEAVRTVDGDTKGIPSGWIPGEHGELFFSRDATKLYLGTAPRPEPEPKDSLADEEKFSVDVWNWKDRQIQPQQKVEMEKEKKRTFLAVYHLAGNRFVQLADPNVREIELVNKGNGDLALGFDHSPYMRSESWQGRGLKDAYVVDLQTGIKRKVISAKNYIRMSPGGKYVVWYDPSDSCFYSMSTEINNPVPINLTGKIQVPFFDELHDSPSPPPPYGIAGWAPDDRFVFIYDRYDIWRIDPAGIRVPVAVTQTFGRRNLLQLRYIMLDRDQEYIPQEPAVLVRAFSEKNLSSGFFSVNFIAVTQPTLLLMDKYNFSNPVKARKAGMLLWSKKNVSQFPDLWVSDMSFTHQQKISEANPQQRQFIWPVVELVEWTSFSGEPLRGLFYKPGNLDPSKKYPMLVYFYERLSDNLYGHTIPAPSRSTINTTFYTSNGYLVFIPDIRYETGYPGRSAYNSIVSGVVHLMSKYQFIDKAHIGLQGQSWGGFQVAWLITQTNLFAAAMAGAPVSNMTSAYGGIRWETGISRMYQYEQTQSRIGGTLWEKPLQFIENSPLFHVPRVKTPLLIMHNDNDGAVPWYQGIELFMALRRLDKPVWLLNYNNEPHNLKAESWANRMDLDKRMFQFFNHYLKNQPAPPWMESGIPAIKKGETTGYE